MHSSGSRTCCCLAAGFGAAKHLSEQGYAVTLLDAAANPGGLSAGWRTAKGRVVEAGMKGFWYQVRDLLMGYVECAAVAAAAAAAAMAGPAMQPGHTCCGWTAGC
jgi:hypothetical protein